MKCLFIPFFFVAISVLAEEPQKLLEALRAELQAEMKAVPENAPPDVTQWRYQFQAALSQILPEGEELTDEQLPQLLRELPQLQTLSHSKKVDELCAALVTEVRNRTVKEAKELQERFSPPCIMRWSKAWAPLPRKAWISRLPASPN